MPELPATWVIHSWVIDLQSHEMVYRVDFDLVDDDGCLNVSSRFAGGRQPPRPGAQVYLLDAGGRGCVATVEDVLGAHARVRPAWTTWTGGRLPSSAAISR